MQQYKMTFFMGWGYKNDERAEKSIYILIYNSYYVLHGNIDCMR